MIRAQRTPHNVDSRKRRAGRRAILFVLLSAAPALAQHGVSDGQWRRHNGDAGATCYSSLDQITPENVGSLEIAWRFRSANFGPTPEFKSETTPLLVDGVLYFTAGFRRDVVAIDAGSAETLWTFRFDEGERGAAAPRKNSGRGVAHWTDGQGDARIFVATPGFQLIALDAATGRPVTGFGGDGIVDMKLGLDQPVDLEARNVGSSSPPLVFEDFVIIGPAMASDTRPSSKAVVRGHVTAWDVRTGQRRWIFHTVPKPGEYGYDTWEGGAVDVETGTLFVGTATGPTMLALAPEPDYSDVAYVCVAVRVPGPQGLPLFAPPFGRITAIDMNTGQHLWMKPNGGTPPAVRDHEALAGLELPPTGSLARAVLLVTKTLLFAGEGWRGEPYFRAYDKKTGA